MESSSLYKGAKKRRLVDLHDDDDSDMASRFKVLLPNGTSVGMTLRDIPEVPLDWFISAVRKEYLKVYNEAESSTQRKRVNWKSKDIYFKDEDDCIIRNKLLLKRYAPNKTHILFLYDGSAEVPGTFENMWDLTPDTEMLKELPEEYTFETALADLIDNSLQAVWSNDKNNRRLISVNIAEERISIFDTGPGMDGSEENNIVKWGKMGASLHRRHKQFAIGGKPPYLTPFFGMFGYGGPIASMQLGRHALISSKTKDSKKVYALRLRRESLLKSSGSEQSWRTDGSIRDPFEEEMQESPHGSFTKVEIFEPRMKMVDIFQLRCKLKDIYFPYVQCDELTKMGKTIMPIEFQVNGTNLAEVASGEVAVTNMHSGNGPEFVLQLHFSRNQEIVGTKTPGKCLRASLEANARIKCVYIPIVQGKENIDRILETLKTDGCEIAENYENFSHVSIRRLGRLLPDARWANLPFMNFSQKRGEKASMLKRCCSRVKCFIDTDAGFNPTPPKTDLAHHNPFTIALKNFGSKHQLKEDIQVEVHKDGRLLTPIQLEKDYQEWIIQMHERCDEEIDCGKDEPVLVLNPTNKKKLFISSDVVRVHQILERKGVIWKRGQKVKIIKGACAGFHRTNVYATIEYFLLEGFQGDAGGEARIICRQLGVTDENGCVLAVNKGDARLDICDSSSLPLSVIDNGKFVAVETSEWRCQLEKQRQKEPSMIEVLSARHCQELEIQGVLHTNSPIPAGSAPPESVVAVVRPGNFTATNALDLDQQSIVRSDLEMLMQVTFRGKDEGQEADLIYSTCIKCSSHQNIEGLYIFPLGSRHPDIFRKAGITYSHSIWVGSYFKPLLIACFDTYDNQIPFSTIPDLKVKLITKEGVLLYEDRVKAVLSSENLILEVEDVIIESNQLEKIEPNYEATLVICELDEEYSASTTCIVIPGSIESVILRPPLSEIQLIPDSSVKELVLQIFDEYGNHVTQGAEIQLDLDGLCIMDNIGEKRKVDINGYVDLSGILKVTAGYGKRVLLSILSESKVVYKQENLTEKRTLEIASNLPERCVAGSQLENVIFEVRCRDGTVDQNIHNEEKHGRSHTLTIASGLQILEDPVRYIFKQGRCVVPSIPIPHKDGQCCFLAAHSRYRELHFSFKIDVMHTPELENVEMHTSCSKVQYSFAHEQPNIVMSLSPLQQSGNMKLAKKIRDIEAYLKELDILKQAIEQQLSELPEEELVAVNKLEWFAGKEEVAERIESRANSAAAILCAQSRSPSQEPEDCFMEDVVGVVALLGTVSNYSLSRMLAQFLGKDQMVAIVCRSYAAACNLETYNDDGNINFGHSLHAKAASMGKLICGRFTVICLEDLRAYDGDFVNNDPQRRLDLPEPTLAAGEQPLGFMGYAVNMINIGMYPRTNAGHGLRETLFYHLFNKLQVYDTREHLKNARECIVNGGISLDGGMIKDRGTLSLGYSEPKIYFPIEVTEDPLLPSGTMGVQMKMEVEYKKKLSLIDSEIQKTSKSHKKYLRRFKKKEECHRMMDGMQPLDLDCKPSVSGTDVTPLK